MSKPLVALEGPSRLAWFVRQRRRDLDLTQEDIANRRGPSTATLRLIEAGRQDEFRRSTIEALEVALDWRPGSVNATLRGDNPVVLDPEDVDRNVRPPTQADDVLLSLPPEALEGLGPAEREEVVAAARLSALRAAREIRRRVDDEADQRR